MRKLFVLLLLVSLSGCASIEIPNYVKDKNPYKKSFAGSYEETLSSAKAALASSGWKIIGQADPSEYEHSRLTEDENIKQTVIFTDVRQTGLFLGTRYARVNVFLQANKEGSTDVELRYITANSVIFKTFYNYKHDKAANRLFKSIEENLTSQE